MRPFLIIKTGQPDETITRQFGSFEDWILSQAGVSATDVRIVNVARGATLPRPARFSGAIITGSPAMVTAGEPWMRAAAAWLKQALPTGLPVLGICFGHQLLAYALGGRTGNNPRGREIGTVGIRLLPAASRDPLFGGLPTQLTVHVTHVQSVTMLPPGAIRLATNAHEPNHAFRFGRHAWGVQFHPEITAPVMRALIRCQRTALRAEGLDPDALSHAVHSSSVGQTILRRFVAIARQEAVGAHPPGEPPGTVGR